jgi:hypothetical protein
LGIIETVNESILYAHETGLGWIHHYHLTMFDLTPNSNQCDEPHAISSPPPAAGASFFFSADKNTKGLPPPQPPQTQFYNTVFDASLPPPPNCRLPPLRGQWQITEACLSWMMPQATIFMSQQVLTSTSGAGMEYSSTSFCIRALQN